MSPVPSRLRGPRRTPGGPPRSRVAVATAVLGAAALLAGGCGHGTAAAGDREEPEEERLVELLRVLGHDREDRAEESPAGRTPGRLAMTIERPSAFGTDRVVPPADHEAASRLTPEEVLLSFAMYGDEGRHAEQWELLSEPTRRAWRERVRRAARRVGLPEVEDRVAASEARRLWARGFDAGGPAITDLAVRWRTTVADDRATVRILREDGTVVDDVPLVREHGGWRLELADRLGTPGDAGGSDQDDAGGGDGGTGHGSPAASAAAPRSTDSDPAGGLGG